MRTGIMNWIDHKRYHRAKRRRRMTHFAIEATLTLLAIGTLMLGVGTIVAVYFHVLAMTG
jgi:hypothetical protein